MNVVSVRDGALILTLGHQPRRPDPREQRYAFTATVTPGAVDLTQARTLVGIDGIDCRTPVDEFGQGGVGSCAAFAAEEAAADTFLASGRRNVVILHPGYIYARARQKENGAAWQADTGSDPADDLDVVIAGAPPKFGTADSYDGNNAAKDYADLQPLVRPYDLTLTHRPIWATAGHLLENIWTALDQRMALTLAMAWTNPFFSPQKGVLALGSSQGQAVGYHALSVWGIYPDSAYPGGGLVCCRNHWTRGWCADAPDSGHDLRAGDFAIPWAYFTDTSNGIIQSLRAVTAQPLPRPPVVINGYSLEGDPAFAPWLVEDAAWTHDHTDVTQLPVIRDAIIARIGA